MQEQPVSRESKLDQNRSFRVTPVTAFRAFLLLARSEWRVTLYTWALLVCYLLATDLKPVITTLVLLAVSNYFLTLAVYVLNDLTDVEEDRINTKDRPLPSGAVSQADGIVVFVSSLILAFALVSSLGVPTIALYGISFFMGLAYSFPRIRAKERFPLKLIVGATGGAMWSLTGGVAAGVLNPLVFFATVAFALSCLLAILLGDIADVRGDRATGVKSLPVVIGTRRSVWVALSIPAIIGTLVMVLFFLLHLSVILPLLVIGLSGYMSYSISTLLDKYDDAKACRKVKIKFRLVVPALQLAFLLGLLVL
jgi:4-hydroxybenzoate polyprenyltransferase